MYCNLRGRGSVLYVKDSIRSTEIIVTDNCDASVWCSVALKNNDHLLVGVIYRSPSSTELQNKQLVDTMDNILKHKYSHVLIMGDFNFPEIDWNMDISTAAADHPSQMFMTRYRDWFLHQHVSEPTHYRALQQANILDLVMTNESGMIDTILYSAPVGKSHHMVLNWNFSCCPVTSVSRVKKYLYDKGNYDDMRQYFADIDWNKLLSGKSVNEMWSALSDTIHTAVENFIPHRIFKPGSSRHKKAAWMNDKTYEKIKQKKEAFQRFKETKDSNDYLQYARFRNAAKSEARKALKRL